MQITRTLLKTTHALHGGGSGCYSPYLQVWERQALGLRTSYIGVVSAATAATTAVGVPLLCRLCDRFSGPQRGLAVLTFFDAVLHAVFPILPALLTSEDVTALGCWIVISEVFHSSTYSVLDAVTLLGLHDKLDYGRIRLPAGVSWAITALGVGAAIHIWRPNLSVIFAGYCVAFICIAGIWACVRLPVVPEGSAISMDTMDGEDTLRRRDVSERDTQHAPLMQVLCSLRVFEMGMIMFALGVGASCANTFPFLLIDDLGGSTLIMGLSLVLNVLTETPVFYHSKKIVLALGPRGVLYVGALAYWARLMWYGLAWNAWAVLVAEPLHGLTFALIWSNIAVIGGQIAPVGHETTIQGLMSAVFNGLGGVIGASVGGFLYDRYGQRMFWFMSLVMVFCVATMAFVDCIRYLRR